jgi:hypothetical protein
LPPLIPASRKITLGTDIKRTIAVVRSPMMVDINSEYARAMIRDFIKIQKDILELPNLTTKQKDDINSLGHELGTLSSQADDDKIKTGLIDIMNRLN